MGKVSDNINPKVILSEVTTPAVPAAGQHKVFFDSADSLFKSIDHAGTVTTYGTGLDAEAVRDTIGAALVAGTNVTITVDDAGNTITVASSGGGGGSYAMASQTFSATKIWDIERTESGTFTSFASSPFPAAMGGAQYYNSSAALNDSIGFAFNVPTGTYTILHWAATSSAYAIVTYEIEDAPGAGTYTSLGTLDWYSSSAVYSVKKSLTGLTVAGTGGYRRLRLRSSSKNASSSGYILNLQLLMLLKTA